MSTPLKYAHLKLKIKPTSSAQRPQSLKFTKTPMNKMMDTKSSESARPYPPSKLPIDKRVPKTDKFRYIDRDQTYIKIEVEYSIKNNYNLKV